MLGPYISNTKYTNTHIHYTGLTTKDETLTKTTISRFKLDYHKHRVAGIKKRRNKVRTVVSEVSSVMGNPAHMTSRKI